MTVTMLAFAAIAAFQTAPTTDTNPDGCSHARAAALRFHQPPPGGGMIAEDDADSDVLHYNLDLRIDPAARWIGGHNTMTVRSTIDGLTTFRFRLDNVLNISVVNLNDVAATYARIDSATLEVTLDRPYDTGEEFAVYVEYDGNPVARGFGSIVFDMHAGAPAVFTLSETWFAYTWWPTKDVNTDKATADMAFTVPADMTVASNGVLAGVDDLGDTKRYRWSTQYPTATYLYSFAATNYNYYTQNYVYDGGVMPVDIFIYPEDDSGSHRAAWFKTIDMLAAFAEPFGLYPFIEEKYGVYQFGFGGGMEHQTITGQGTFSEWVTAHEAGHQWWGDLVTCATWHDIWLNEGFATYSEAIWYERKPGSPGKPALLEHMNNRRPRRVDGSVYVYDASNMSRIFSSDFSYRKGAWVLHMLRHVVDDQAFFDVLHAYRAAFAYGAATTDEFRAVAEGVAGRDLGWFFDEWVYDIGAPTYQFGWRQSEVIGRNFVDLYVRQVQDGSYPVYSMPIDIVTTISGADTVNVVWNDAGAEHLLFETDAAIDAIQFDPENWILAGPTAQIGFVEGPPKIVDLSIEPAGEVPQALARSISIVFHKDVVAADGTCSLTGDVVGPLPFDFDYDPLAQTITLDTGDLPPPDHYTLVISDEIVDVAAGLALDGELNAVGNTPLLPSGDGLAGGDATVEFDVFVLLGDVNCDGEVSSFDIEPFLMALFDPQRYPLHYPDCDMMLADLDGNGTVDAFDIEPFLELLFP